MRKASKFICSFSALAIITAIVIYAETVASPGLTNEFLGKYQTSETAVTIDGMPIAAGEFNGDIFIPIEHLSEYGFDVSYDSSTCRFYVTTLSAPARQAEFTPLNSTDFNISLPEYQVYVNGVNIPAFKLDGEVCVSVYNLTSITDDYNKQWGFSDYNMSGSTDYEKNTFNITCFRFKDVDMNAVCAERETILAAPQIELYTKGNPNEAPYYGAKFEPRGGLYAGILSNGNGDPELDKPEIFHHNFAVYSSYLEFDNRQTKLYKPCSYIFKDKNCISQVPWNITDLNPILSGEADGYIRETLDKLEEYNKPTIIRFGAEMNVSSLGDSPSAYVKAFRHMADIVHEYDNFAVMWSPNDRGALDRDFSYYYPGDEYVDWIGVSSFCIKDFLAGQLEGESEADSSRNAQLAFTLGDFGWTTNSLLYITDFMRNNNINKPLAISEGGIATELTYTDEDTSNWTSDRLKNMYWYAPMKFPQLKSIVYFNYKLKQEVVGFDLSNHPSYIETVENALQNGPYLFEYGQTAPYTFVPASDRTYSNNVIPIYTYVYDPSRHINSVDYLLNGNIINTQVDVPYKFDLDCSSLQNGKYIFTVTAHGTGGDITRNYNLIKSDNFINITE